MANYVDIAILYYIRFKTSVLYLMSETKNYEFKRVYDGHKVDICPIRRHAFNSRMVKIICNGFGGRLDYTYPAYKRGGLFVLVHQDLCKLNPSL